MRTVAVDFETFYSKEYSVVDLGYDRYCRHEKFDPYLISVCDGTEVWAGPPRDFNWDSLTGARLVSANAAFDQEVYIAGVEKGLFPVVSYGYIDWACSSNMTSYLWNVRSLADGMRLGFGIEVDKGVRDRAKGKTWDDMIREGWSDDMLKYARMDAQHCFHLWEKYSPQWPADEMRLSNLTIEQGRYGVRIDVPRLHRYIEVLQRVIFTATNNLPWVARGRPPASPLGIAEESRACGIPCPPVKAHDPDAAQAWEDLYAPAYPWVMAIRNLRKAKKTLATLETIKLRLREDGTVAFSLKYFGAHTGRWAGDAGWNLQNMNKEPLFVLDSFSFEFDKPKLKALNKLFDAGAPQKPWEEAIDMRGLIIAREGCKLAPTDLAQIEPRAVNHLAGNRRLLDKVRTGMAIYEAFARESMGWTGGDLKTEDKKKYQLSKIQVLGLGYGCGWNKFITIAKIYETDITEEDGKYALAAAYDGKIHQRFKPEGKTTWVYSGGPGDETHLLSTTAPAAGSPVEDVIFVKKYRQLFGTNIEPGAVSAYYEAQTVYGQQSRALVREFRASNSPIVDLWNMMEAQLRGAVGTDLVVELPSGRALTYRRVRQELRKFEDPETGEKSERRCYTAEIGGRRYVLYGGLIVENITQAVGRDVFAHNWLLCEDAGIRTLFTVHDEIVPEIPANASSEPITRLMSSTPAWLEGCPIGAETKETQRYLK